MERLAVPFAKAILLAPARDRFLLQRRNKPGDRYAGLWEVPGGRIREGESVLAALAREIGEESGIARVEWLDAEGAMEIDGFGGCVRVLLPLVTVEIVGGSAPIFGQYYVGTTEEAPRQSVEAGEHRWISPAEFHAEFLAHPPAHRSCTTVDGLALRLALDGPLGAFLRDG